MATAEERLQVRRNTGEVDSTTYSDEELDARILAASGDLDAASATIWEEKSSAYAELVDISEAGSSRKNGTLYKNAQEKAAFYRGKANDVEVPVMEPGTYSTSRRIVRL